MPNQVEDELKDYPVTRTIMDLARQIESEATVKGFKSGYDHAIEVLYKHLHKIDSDFDKGKERHARLMATGILEQHRNNPPTPTTTTDLEGDKG